MRTSKLLRGIRHTTCLTISTFIPRASIMRGVDYAQEKAGSGFYRPVLYARDVGLVSPDFLRQFGLSHALVLPCVGYF